MPPTLATASIQGVGLLLSMDQRSAWPAAVRTDKRSGIKAKLSPRSGSALTSAHSVCILCFVNCHLDMFHCICWRPYHVECTGSLLTSEVKRHRARLVLGWGTAWEDLRVLPAQQTRQGRGREERGRRRRRRKGKGEGEGKGKGKRQRKRQRPSGLLPLPLPLHLNCHSRQIPVIALLAHFCVELHRGHPHWLQHPSKVSVCCSA